MTDLKLCFPYLSHVAYFSDGCTGQCKNYNIKYKNIKVKYKKI